VAAAGAEDRGDSDDEAEDPAGDDAAPVVAAFAQQDDVGSAVQIARQLEKAGTFSRRFRSGSNITGLGAIRMLVASLAPFTRHSLSSSATAAAAAAPELLSRLLQALEGLMIVRGCQTALVRCGGIRTLLSVLTAARTEATQLQAVVTLGRACLGNMRWYVSTSICSECDADRLV
jgi:hypothetical protein